MSELTDAVAGLKSVASLDALRDIRMPRPRELHATTDEASMPAVTATLRVGWGAELVLMTGEDRRARDGAFRVHYLFAHARENWFAHITTRVDGAHPVIASSAMSCYPASRFEREMRDLMGIVPRDHPDPRPLARHGFWPEDYFPLRKDAVVPTFGDEGRPFPFGEVGGPGVYEIPVGPVHAGIIEPGHFRFSAVGETIIDVKQRLFFTHKGTEKLFEGRTASEGVALAERISGDTTIGHALAFCQAVETAARVDIPLRAAFLRAILLEMERTYNHVADFGMIISDTGYAVAQSQCYRIRERLLRLNGRLTGNRLLRGGLVAGGVAFDIAFDVVPPAFAGGIAELASAGSAGPGPDGRGIASHDLLQEIEACVRDFLEVVDICLDNSLVADRLDRAGVLKESIGRDHAVRGYVARGSGIDIDVRRDHPRPPYDGLTLHVPVETTGDVRARAVVRVAEVKESARLIRTLLESLPPGPISVPMTALPPYEPAFALVEGWRGCIVCWVMGDDDGRLHRVKVVDPSFLNWPALSRALVDNIVPDFPLCNKSFNLSYSGNDL
jgi:Ni,Fe-hydrogenase III large subunit/Ni,Fe-hydrogenase III component G